MENLSDMSRLIDQNRKPIFRLGGSCMILAGIIIIAVAVLSNIIGSAPGADESYLKSVSDHADLSMVNFGIYSAADILLLLGSVAILFALKSYAKNAVLIGMVIFIFFIIMDLAVTETNSLALTILAKQYAAATTDLQRSEYVSAAYYALSTLPIGTFFSYVGSSIGLLIISLSMRKGVFNRLTVLAGIIASVTGIVGGFYVIIQGLAVLLTPCLLAYGLWALLSGHRLYRLGVNRNAK